MSEFLCQMDLFKGLSKEELGKIVDAVKERHFKDGEYIFHQGDHGEDFFIISSGMRTQGREPGP